MCQPLLFLLTPFSWSYAQEQQFIEQSLLKGSYFSNISYVFSRDFNAGMPWFQLRFSAFSEYIYLLGSFSICYLILTLQSEFTATAGHCQELRSQILKSISTHSIKPRPHVRLPLSERAAFHFSHGWTFFFFFFSLRFTSLYLENAMYVCNRIKEIINDGKQNSGLVVFMVVFSIQYNCNNIYTAL